jgi:hypothetical protein
MKILFISLSLFLINPSFGSSKNLCTEFKQAFVDSKRFHKKDCKINTDCELVDLRWDSCKGELSLRKDFIQTGLKHFQGLREKAHGACKFKKPTCVKISNMSICNNRTCTSLNEFFDKTPNFKIYLKFEGLTTPPKSIVLRREHTVYCITAPCPPLVTDQKIKLLEGTLIVNRAMIPYPDIHGDIQYFLMLSGYKRIHVSKSKLIELQNETIELKLSEKR